MLPSPSATKFAAARDARHRHCRLHLLPFFWPPPKPPQIPDSSATHAPFTVFFARHNHHLRRPPLPAPLSPATNTPYASFFSRHSRYLRPLFRYIPLPLLNEN